jgi:exodeoxyribonuclease VII small subunit
MESEGQGSYREALTELEGIMAEIEGEDVDIDTLTDRVRRAASLIGLCRGRLRNAEEELRKMLAEMEETLPGDSFQSQGND